MNIRKGIRFYGCLFLNDRRQETRMTINEIAKLAGVSRATVSRYLNQGYVSEEKKEAIRKVIEETGYEPSQQARTLRSKMTNLIGVIIPRIQSEAVSRMVAGISEVLSAQGYELLLANTQNDPKQELKYLKIFRKNRVDGILYMGTMFSKEHLRLMEESDVPIVVVAQEVEKYSCVYQDDYHAACELTKVLVKNVEHCGYVGVTTKDKAVGDARKKGYLQAMHDLGKKADKDRMFETQFRIQGGYEKAKELMEKYPDTDAIFCATDSLAMGVLRYLKEQHIAVPEQVKLAGFGDTEMGSAVFPAITSVHFYYKTTGIEAAKLMLEILRTDNDIKKQIKMGFEIAEKETTL